MWAQGVDKFGQWVVARLMNQIGRGANNYSCVNLQGVDGAQLMGEYFRCGKQAYFSVSPLNGRSLMIGVVKGVKPESRIFYTMSAMTNETLPVRATLESRAVYLRWGRWGVGDLMVERNGLGILVENLRDCAQMPFRDRYDPDVG